VWPGVRRMRLSIAAESHAVGVQPLEVVDRLVEIEIGVLRSQCLDRHMLSQLGVPGSVVKFRAGGNVA
jgi:hypothetical protein